ncbi:MAG: portal protein [Bacilli bacterium]|nr:portal protein [Bacilli bacterium]
MALFKRKSKQTLNEGNANNYEIAGLDSFNFIRGLRNIASDTYNVDYVLDRMLDDAIISSAIDMYIDDTLQVDPQKQEIFWVEVDNTDDRLEDELAKGLTTELNNFLKSELQMNKNLRQILRRVIVYGSCPTRLDFIDKLEDDRLTLIDKNKKTFESVSEVIQKDIFSGKEQEDLTGALSKLKEGLDYNLEKASDYDIKKKIEELVKASPGKKKLKEDVLSRDDKENVRRLMRGRWYTEIVSSGTNIWELCGKGKTLAYMDVRKPNFLINPINIVNFSNDTGKYFVNFEVGPYQEVDTKKDYFVLKRGQSYLDKSIVAWQVLSALEDILLLTRMTRSTLYRIFSVEVGNKGDVATKQLLQDLKNKIKLDETINVKERIYNSDLRQIPLGDSIFIPTRNGIGNIDVKVVGGDVNLKDAIDLDYFKDKLFASLGIPKAFLGFSEENGGGLINTSLTRMDIRYARTIKGIQQIAAEGLKELCLKYLSFTRPESVLRELPDFKIVFTSINTEEDNQRCETKQVQMETLGKILEAFEGLGISVGETPTLRDELIKEWLGSNYLEIIKEATKDGTLAQADEGGSGLGGPSLGGGPSLSGGPSLDTFDGGPDLDNLSDENPAESDIDLDTEPIGANDTDFEANPSPEAPSGLRRTL